MSPGSDRYDLNGKRNRISKASSTTSSTTRREPDNPVAQGGYTSSSTAFWNWDSEYRS